VSTVVAARPASLSAPRTDSAIPLRRGALVAIAVGGLLAAVGGGLLVATSNHLLDPIAYGIQLALMLVGTVAAALYWLVRRPGNRLGWALLALAGATGALTLNGASSPLLHTMGVAVEPVFFLLSYYVVFAFPDGRIRGLWEKALLAAMALYFLTGFVPYLFFSPVVSGGAPLGGCGAACPENAFMIADRPTIAASYGSDGSYAVIVIMLATLACLVYRLGTATRPRRRALIPVYIPALTLTVPILVFHGVITELLSPDPEVISNAGWSVTVSRVVLPYGFLLAVVQSAFFAAAALKTIVRRLNESPTGPQLRATMADALDDPSLEIAFAVDLAGGFVDANGKPIDPTPAAGRTATPVTQNGDTVAVVVHDDALNTDPELVDVAGHALLLAVENDRLQHELQLSNAELRATRARIVSAGDSERRKIERDLHDGAQQHLVALRIRVGLATELADPVTARRLVDVGAELEEILDELRDLAQGLYPPLLREFGLYDALVGVARRSAPPARIEGAGIGRYPEETEAAVYFCCVESLQNVGKHAGVGANAVVRLWQDVGRLWFEIEDDGVGCDLESVSRSGAGYTNMTDRIASVGGALAVESRLGEGTKVRGSVPADGRLLHEARPVSAATRAALTNETA
jgi:signal transduction histidine kinase